MVGLQRQHGQQRALLGGAQEDETTVEADLDDPQQADLHDDRSVKHGEPIPVRGRSPNGLEIPCAQAAMRGWWARRVRVVMRATAPTASRLGDADADRRPVDAAVGGCDGDGHG